MTVERELIEEYMGRSVNEAERASVPTLNDVDGELLATLRAWPRPRAFMWGPRCLRFFVHRSEGADLVGFIEAVHDGSVEPAHWERGDMFFSLLGGPYLHEIYTIGVSDVISDLAGIAGSRYYRRSSAGSLGVLFPDFRYWMNPNASAPHTGRGRAGVLEHLGEAELPIALRRWQAARISWYAGPTYWAAGNPTVESLTHQITHFFPYGRPKENAGVPNLSVDAVIAMRALIAEFNLKSPEFEERAGTLGPDEWYR